MPNFTVSDNEYVFKINGADKSAALIMIILITLSLAIFLLALFILNETDFLEDNLILSAVILFAVTMFYLTGIIYLIKKGAFSRYNVIINQEKIEVYDKRSSSLVFSDAINPDYLYSADFRQQAGYVSIKIKALCYGPVKQLFVEDRVPSFEFILLCTGPEKKISELKNKIKSAVKK